MENIFNKEIAQSINLDKFNAINANHEMPNLSSKYKFANMKEIIEVLADNDWFPVSASQARTLKEERAGYQKHMITLASSQYEKVVDVAGTLPRIVIKAAHDGTSSLQIIAGLFEKICSNGLMVGSQQADFRISHIAFTPEKLEQGIKYIQKQLVTALNFSDKARHIMLDREEERALAASAVEMVFDGDTYSVEPESLLRRRHYAQKEPNLWNSFNAIQENVIKGGVRQTRKDNTRIKSRAVNAIDRNIALNKGLYVLAEKMAELKGVSINA